MADRVRGLDWAGTSLGRSESWPGPLRASVEMMLASPLIASVVVGRERVLIYNDASARQYGLNHPRALGRPLGETFDEYRLVAPFYDRVFAGESVHVPAQPLDPSDEAPEIYEAFLVPVRDESGHVIAAHMTGFAIGERLRAEAARQTSEAQLALAIDIGEIGYWEFAPETGGLTTSPHFRRHFGRSPDAPFGCDELLASIHPDDRARHEGVVSAAVAAESGFEIEYRVVTAHGETRWVHVHGRHEPSRPPRLVGVSRDITGRKAAEAASAADLADTTLLRDLAERLVSEDDVPRIFEEILSAAIALTRADAGTMQLYDPAGQALVLLVTRGFPRHMTDYFHHVDASSETACGLALKTGVRTFADFDDDGDPAGRMHAEAGYRSAQATPLITRGRMPIGMINTHWRASRHRPDDRELRYLDLLARQAADMTAQRQAQAALRESEERKAFLLALGDRMRGAETPEAVIAVATGMLGEKLEASRIVFAEIDEAAGVARIREGWTATGVDQHPSVLKLADFGGPLLDRLRAGETVRFDDVGAPPYERSDLAALAAIGVKAGLSVPLIVGGRFVTNINVHQDRPRSWTVGEVALVEEVGERIWDAVERARTEAMLRDGEQRFRALATTGAFSIYRMSPDWRLMYQLDSDTLATTVDPIEDWVEKYIPDDDLPAVRDAIGHAIRTKSMFELEHRVRLVDGGTGWVLSRAVPLLDERGEILEWFGAGSDVTERRQAVERLRTSEARYQALFAASPVPFMVLAANPPDYTITAANEAYYAATLTTPETLIGRRLFDVFTDDPGRPGQLGSEALGISLERVLRTRRTDGMERVRYDLLTPDGRFTEHWWLAINAPLFDAAGNVTAIIHQVERQTELHRAEAARRESEERLRQFGEASQDILWIRDAETFQWVYLTPAFEQIYGLSRDQVLSGDSYRNWQDLIVPADRDQAVAAISRVRSGERVTFEFRVSRPSDGTVRWMRNTDFPITDETGKVVLIGGIGHDFTEVREAELRFRTLVDGMPQLVWRAVDGGEWTWASPQWTEYTGQTERGSEGWGWIETLHPDDRSVAREAWSHAIEQGGIEVEYRLRRQRDGAYRWFQTRATPVRDDDGTIVEWLGTSTDVHDLRELQDRQKVLVAELQHRTRNLMGVVRSMADKTARAASDLPDFRGRFRDRLEALSRVQGLLSRLNDMDRVTFDDLIGTELAAMDGSADRVTLNGPHGVRLRSSTVQTLAMALHELSTNALKYGALGQSSGKLAITWKVETSGAGGKPWLHIDWLESGVDMPPSGSAPRGTGQGRELIEKALPYQLSAETTYTLGSDGVHCTISIPVSANNGEPHHQA